MIFRGNKIGRATRLVVGGVAPGKFYPFKVIRDWVQQFGQGNVEMYLTKAIFDPDYAQIMTMDARQNLLAQGVIPSSLQRLMTIIALEAELPEKVSEKVNKQVPVGFNPPAK